MVIHTGVIGATVVPLMLVFASFSVAQPEVVTELYDGLDPVELLAGREVPGDDALAINHGSYRFLFANAANRTTFERDPARYEPAVGGVCARMGPNTAGSPALFAVHDGRIYLFGTPYCQKLFAATPSRYIDAPSDSPAFTAKAVSDGRILAAALGEAVGGASKLLAVTAFRETIRIDRPTPKGPQASEERLLVQYPANFRHERDFPSGTLINAVSDVDAFSVVVEKTGLRNDRRPAPARLAFAAHMRERAALMVISVLKSTQDSTSVLAATEAPPGLDPSLRYLRIRHGVLNAMLGIDPKTHLPRLLTYRGRTTGGAFATIVLNLDDYRDVAGILLPYRVSVSADGLPDPFQTHVVTEWSLNPRIEANAFTRPVKASVAGQQQ